MTSSETQVGGLSTKTEVRQRQVEWSLELLVDIDRQCGLWTGMLTKLTQNLAWAGTPQMVVYSPEEREQLDIMVSSMTQLSSCIGGERAEKIAALHRKTLLVLSAYDDLMDAVRRYDD